MGACRTPRYTVRTSKIGPGPPRVQAGPLEWDLDPPCMGSEPPTMGSQGSRTEHTRALFRTQAGSGADTCLDLIWLSCTLLLPAQAETRCYHVAYCARHKPTGGT
jgi:hypothetical protein